MSLSDSLPEEAGLPSLSGECRLGVPLLSGVEGVEVVGVLVEVSATREQRVEFNAP